LSINYHRGPIGLGQSSRTFKRLARGPILDERVVTGDASPAARGPHGIAEPRFEPSLERQHLSNLVRSASPRRQTLTPVQFADLFHNLEVSYFDPQSGMAHSVTVDVHIYNNNGIDDCRANMSEKAALVSALRQELRRAGGLALIGVEQDHKYQVAHCFFGKGNPDEFRVTLSHALRHNRATPAGLQNYCDRQAKLGVDCSGFVNTYFERIGRISAHKNISEYERGTLRSSVNDIQDLDVLVWQGGRGRHIAVIDHVIVGSDPLKMIVVESAHSKHGLTTSEYTVLGVNGQIFRVNRGGGSSGSSRVKIAAV